MTSGNQAHKSPASVHDESAAAAKRWLPHVNHPPAVTLSRQTGCDIMAVARDLADLLEARDPARPHHHWTVLDKDLIEKVLEEHKLPQKIAKFMPEARVSAIQDAIEELLGLHPSSKTLLHKISETILHLAEAGHVILTGRAANLITRDMRSVFHVRLVAPLDRRVERIMARDHLDAKAARDFIRKSDLGRKRYLKDHFHADIDDSLHYDLVINTARLPHRAVAQVLGDAFVHWAQAQ
jgi:cytidylate kinase